MRINRGPRQHLLQVYSYMAGGLTAAGVAARFVGSLGFHIAMMNRMPFLLPFMWIVLLAPLGLLMLFWLEIDELGPLSTQAIFWVYSALTGFSFGCVSLVYTGASLAPMFLVGAGAFAAMSAYGYATGNDLSRPGHFAGMGLAGLALAGVVHIFRASTALEFALSAIGVIALVSLTAWDNERIEELYLDSNRSEIISDKALVGAFALFLDANPLFLLVRLENLRRE